MSTNNEEKSIKEAVLGAIQSGKVKMLPRWRFVLQSILLVLGSLLLATLLIYMVSLAMFVLRQIGVWYVPYLGFRGIGVFLWSMPWFLIVIAILFVAVLEILFKRYSFGYRKPLLATAFGIIAFALIGGFLVSITPLHSGLSDRARDGRLPMAGGFYRNYDVGRMSNFISGEVVELFENGFVLKLNDEQNIRVNTNERTKIPFDEKIETGDNVTVVGERKEDGFAAFGIRVGSFGGMPMMDPNNMMGKPKMRW